MTPHSYIDFMDDENGYVMARNRCSENETSYPTLHQKRSCDISKISKATKIPWLDIIDIIVLLCVNIKVGEVVQ